MMLANHASPAGCTNKAAARNLGLMGNPETASGTNAITRLVYCRAGEQVTVSHRIFPAHINNVVASAYRASAYFVMILRQTKGCITSLTPEPRLIKRNISSFNDNRKTLYKRPGKFLPCQIVNP